MFLLSDHANLCRMAYLLWIILVSIATESFGMGVASIGLAAFSFGMLTFPFPLSLVSTLVKCHHVSAVIMVPLTTNALSESNFGTLCRMQILVISKGKTILFVLFSIQLNVSSTMIRPTLICHPMMIECNKAFRSSEMVSLCDIGIKLAFKKWFHTRAWEFKASLFTDRPPFGAKMMK
ncbi:hypothetical protein V6N12_058298 [Hibiscus sabdariffa]|uniref:Uncharacterized protein n=1 Tax=Hibiscus sabdariffa TaxID=183260 RepID=A0ABR2ERV5_9ROSI